MSNSLPTSVGTALGEAIDLFALKTIQNNLSENVNSTLQSLLRLRGPKTIESVERRIRAVIIIRNNPEFLEKIQIDRNLRSKFYINNLKVMELPDIENWVIST